MLKKQTCKQFSNKPSTIGRPKDEKSSQFIKGLFLLIAGGGLIIISAAGAASSSKANWEQEWKDLPAGRKVFLANGGKGPGYGKNCDPVVSTYEGD